MKITIESTAAAVDHKGAPARMWQGKTESGIPVFCLIPVIACNSADDQSEFQRELHEVVPPTVDVAAQVFPLRMLI